MIESIQAEFIAGGGIIEGSRCTGPAAAKSQLEPRLLAFVREPALLQSTYDKILRADLSRMTPEEIRLIETAVAELADRSDIWHAPLEVSHSWAWEALVHLRSARFGGFLLEFSRDDRRVLRAVAARYLAWLGADEFIPDIVRFLRDPDPLVVTHAVAGVEAAATDGYAARTLRDQAFEVLAHMVSGERLVAPTGDPRNPQSSAARALLKLDQTEGMKLLASSRVLRADNPVLPNVVVHLVQAAEQRGKPAHDLIDRDAVWSVYDIARNVAARTRDAKHESIAAEMLKLAACCEPERARREAAALQRLDTRETAMLRGAAGEVLRRVDAVPGPDAVLEWIDSHPGKLAADAECVIRAYQLALHVQYDGFPLYWGNLGEHWTAACAGLRLLRLEPAADEMRRASLTFGPDGPPTDHAQREIAFDALTDEHVALLQEVGARFDDLTTTIFRATEQYISRHRAKFSEVSV